MRRYLFLPTLLLLLCFPSPTPATALVEAEQMTAEQAPPPPTRLSNAAVQSYDPDSWMVIGSIREHRVREWESLLEIARDYGLGYREITAANPGLDPILPGEGKKVTIPGRRVLPQFTPSTEPLIVVNLAEKRLYYFHRRGEEAAVVTYPVGIGADYGETPIGEYRISAKLVEPSWTVPPSIRQRRPWLPPIVPPGPDNPMGRYAMQLSGGSYFIHGTNRPWSIGRRSTQGCIRLYPEDISALFPLVAGQTMVIITHQPLKIGLRQDEIYLEIHPAEDLSNSAALLQARQQLQAMGLYERVGMDRLLTAIAQRQGMAVRIGGD